MPRMQNTRWVYQRQMKIETENFRWRKSGFIKYLRYQTTGSDKRDYSGERTGWSDGTTVYIEWKTVWGCFQSYSTAGLGSSFSLSAQKHATANEICYYKVRGFANTKALL